jgi:hypothetical protein
MLANSLDYSPNYGLIIEKKEKKGRHFAFVDSLTN